MLAQIDVKNNLKNISKRLIEIEMYQLMCKSNGMNEKYMNDKNYVNKLDLEEFKEAFSSAKKRNNIVYSDDYHIFFYEKLPYVVPIAFQGTIALIFDLEEIVINNIYNLKPNYKIRNISICIFPLEENSIIMLFVDKKIKDIVNFLSN